MDLNYSADLSVDCNNKTSLKRASFIRTIENFPTFDGDLKSYGKPHIYYNFAQPCSVNYPCKKCYEEKAIVENGHTFNFDLDSKVKCSLNIHPYGRDSVSKDYVSISLEFKESSRLKITALCKFSILDPDGKEEYKSIVGVEKFDSNKSSHFLQKFINRNDLLRRESILLPNKKLTVRFEIFYLFDDVNASGVSETTHIDEHLNVFLKDIKRMLDSQDFYDCIIKVGNSEINVHKCILTTRSEVFRSTLKKKLTAFQSNTLEMSGFRLEVVKEMVNYLYTGRSPKIGEVAIEMLEITDKYKLEGLKMIATESLLNGLNVENVCEYLEKSELYSAEILKEFCIRYIYLNAEEVVKGEKWRKIVNFYPLLLERIFNVTAGID
uniref:Speckle-type POZ protein n=1 Tax=Strongyloides papillosus TaxID=174720 RepID=A0A0N5BCB4_STREA